MAASYAPARWPVATATTLLWAAAAASLAFWGLRLFSPADTGLPPVVAGASALPLDTGAVARVLGAQPEVERVVPTPDAATRFKLLGVVADDLGRGAALIAVDGKAARPYRPGALLVDRYVLQSVEGRKAVVGADSDGPALFSLELPALPMAVNGAPRPLPPMEP